ncbi:MAG: folylpolyglutamate synthase/dihydrofolate synthase family protein [Pseudomonadota bacterium]
MNDRADARAKRQSEKVSAALARIAAKRPRVIDLSLERMLSALAALDDPHKNLPPLFHVAGTNGKGSTLAFLRAVLEASGARVHTYTSPHLVTFNERIVLAGAPITDDALADVLARCDAAVGEGVLTYFEFITCAAFLAFSETPADYLLLEVGLGGRLDATNVVEQPLASLVAPVGMDHRDYLGDTIEKIAAEKAGVFKRGVPAVIGPQSAAAMAILRAEAERAGAPVFAFGTEWDARAEQGRLIFQDETRLSDLAPPRLFGAHQYDNAGLAIAGLRAASLKLDDAVLSKGIANAVWPGRLQRLKEGPLIALAERLLGAAPEIWLDGGHNPHAAAAAARAMGDLEERSARRLVLITGMQNNKDADGFFTAFAGAASMAFTVEAGIDSAAPREEIAAAAERAGVPAAPAASMEDAVTRACRGADGKGAGAKGTDADAPRILICGSLYLAGDVLADHR